MDLLKKVVELEQAADKLGLRWENTSQIMDQIQSECAEINVHLNEKASPDNQAELQEEIGDLLHAVFSLCVFCNLNPKETLEITLAKFERRLNAVKQLTHEHGLSTLEGLSFAELMDIWKRAKQLVG
ncbi:MazG nucleotide pyrophosphohydrolase domain-containing protein [Legionella londiniensis]|uniref:Nucleoside triphosphate pyrophosphohydrolase MazG n=1 Tax=Legionella londiniensis TaxID=45068 RepID=A0A0W0VLV9_9GAMM|nr:MazG nucleotide pyrophosphohydrolase domain-containing protein [Legionella londiniensis]KTD21022.1 nucleoside triphosphate pyrophosphohydrolase MazG [Legionella londiniensis]STX93703.1 nucleoside triphosphate pyrophosphohydrolase MazG [Legionella londiniensis]